MSILSAIKHDLGIVEGILIPGASASTTILTHMLQQQIADAYGAAITTAVTNLVPETSMTGPEKALAIAEAVADNIVTKGVKAEVTKLRDTVLDIVQAAYRAVEPSIGSDIMALATAYCRVLRHGLHYLDDPRSDYPPPRLYGHVSHKVRDSLVG